MNRVLIDFSGARPAPPRWTVVLFAVGAALCIGAVWRGSDLSARQARAGGDLERVRGAVSAARPQAVARPALPDAQIAAINRAVVQLNLPWQALFQSLEQARPANVALLTLDPNGEKRTLRILAEAKTPEDMLDFVRLLRERPQFADAVLTKHEIYTQDPNRPLRFTVDAIWKASL